MKTVRRLIEILDVKIVPSLNVNEYDYDTNTISLNIMTGTAFDRWVRKTMGRHVDADMPLYHELGHAVFELHDIDERRKAVELFGDFEQEYRGTLGLVLSVFNEPNGSYVSKYAQEHPEEDFAECFAVLMKHGNRVPDHIENKKLRRKLEYVKKLVKEILAP